MKIKIKFGQSEVEIESKDIKELFEQATFFTNLTKCKICESADLGLNHRRVTAKQGANQGKTFDYYSIKCRSCGAEGKLGERQDGSGFYLKDWEGPENDRSPVPSPDSTSAPVHSSLPKAPF